MFSFIPALAGLATGGTSSLWSTLGKYVLPAVIGGASSLIGSSKQSSAAKKAAEASAKSDAEALAFAREQEATRRKEYEQMIAAERAQWEAEEARRSPYRQASYGILQGAADRLGYTLGDLGGYPTSASATAASAKSKFAPSPYSSDSLAALAGFAVQNPKTPDIEPEPLTLGNLGRKRSVGDWRAGRAV